MITHLPDILYRDELIYSWLSRYYIHVGCISHKMALKDLFQKRSSNPSKEFIGFLNPDAERLIAELYDMDDLVLNHTMFPQYARFIPPEQKKQALEHIKHDFKDVHHLFAVLPRAEEDRFLKYCPLCVSEDREKYAEAYWHRVHQIRGMNVCCKHKCFLKASQVKATSEMEYTFSPAELYVNDSDATTVDSTQLLQYSEYMEQIFNAPIDFDNEIPISAIFYKAMQGTKYMKKSGRSRYTGKLVSDMNAYYSDMGLKTIASLSQVQRHLLVESRFDFQVICQLGFFMGIPYTEFVSPSKPNSEIIEKEKESHYIRNREHINWEEYDSEMSTKLEKVAHDIYYGVDGGRPERVSEKSVYREMGLPGHRLELLPQCRSVLAKYSETYEEAWARRIIWAYKVLKVEKQDGQVYASDLRKKAGVKMKHADEIVPFLAKHADRKTCAAIRKIICSASKEIALHDNKSDAKTHCK